ncbi:LysR family transcriptional regulator [Bacillus subtilis]|uniref:LysR family transcriptional regulator n=1 Tax=Pseudochrobactrum asaccharolyticum TaxID=354351 RepID=UPI001EFF65DF|nr:LysR family transcriptional regulator [Pseudochrobactrum asaccharolyticum]MCF7643948.1 LysR family transcriptional regulator [Pseudochrobactrum asaccharolyticum]MCF7670815.1 LysR family transcriptional regulator [Bacillus subtilis]
MQTLLDLDQLRTFLLIAETGSFTKTADSVFRTQSAISMQIRRLEERIGKPLFTRDGRALQLTPHGEKLLTYARRMLELNHETIVSFRTNKVQANIRLGLPDLYLEHMIEDALQPIFRDYPAVETILQCEPTDALIEHIRRGSLDLALIVQPAGQKRTEVLNSSRFVWVTSAENSPHEQAILPLAMNRANCSWRQLLTDALNTIQREYRIILSTTSTRSTAMAVRAGNAITILPENMVESGMRILTEEDGFPKLPSCCLTLIRAQGIHAPAIDLIAASIKASFRKTIRISK